VAAIFDTLLPGNTKLIWHYMFNVGHEPAKIADACKLMAQMCKHFTADTCLLEYQAPMGNVHASRWNCYTEGALAACLSSMGLNVVTLHPSAVKRKLKLATGNYADNKREALKFAKDLCPEIDSHHLADCFVMAEYHNRYVVNP
jgi:hypothetical protein